MSIASPSALPFLTVQRGLSAGGTQWFRERRRESGLLSDDRWPSTAPSFFRLPESHPAIIDVVL